MNPPSTPQRTIPTTPSTPPTEMVDRYGRRMLHPETGEIVTTANYVPGISYISEQSHQSMMQFAAPAPAPGTPPTQQLQSNTAAPPTPPTVIADKITGKPLYNERGEYITTATNIEPNQKYYIKDDITGSLIQIDIRRRLFGGSGKKTRRKRVNKTKRRKSMRYGKKHRKGKKRQTTL